MSENGKTIIEVNGVKLEVDLRHARRVDELRVGDRVKVLYKHGYSGSDYKVGAGTVIGFEPFKNLPTIIVAYVEVAYSGAELKFVHFNAQTKDVEIVKAIDDDAIDLNRDDVLKYMDRAIGEQETKVQQLKDKKAYFLRHFGAYWAPVEKTEAPI